MTTLNDFIEYESNDITEQLKYFDRLDKILDNVKSMKKLTKLFENKDDDHDDDDDRENKSSKRSSNERQKYEQQQPTNVKKSVQQLKNRKIDFEKIKKFENNLQSINEQQRKLNEQKLLSKNNRQKLYRQDLLKQINDKKNQMKLMNDYYNNDDFNDDVHNNRKNFNDLDNKIAQQRLAMYLEYLDERNNMQFSKDNDNAEKSNRINDEYKKRRPSYITFDAASNIVNDDCLNDNKFENKRKDIQNVDNGPLIYDDNSNDNGDGSASGSKDQNDGKLMNQKTKDNFHLADLNEVRRIMHVDHYELLEKLADLNIDNL